MSTTDDATVPSPSGVDPSGGEPKEPTPPTDDAPRPPTVSQQISEGRRRYTKDRILTSQPDYEARREELMKYLLTQRMNKDVAAAADARRMDQHQQQQQQESLPGMEEYYAQMKRAAAFEGGRPSTAAATGNSSAANFGRGLRKSAVLGGGGGLGTGSGLVGSNSRFVAPGGKKVAFSAAATARGHGGRGPKECSRTVHPPSKRGHYLGLDDEEEDDEDHDDDEDPSSDDDDGSTDPFAVQRQLYERLMRSEDPKERAMGALRYRADRLFELNGATGGGGGGGIPRATAGQRPSGPTGSPRKGAVSGVAGGGAGRSGGGGLLSNPFRGMKGRTFLIVAIIIVFLNGRQWLALFKGPTPKVASVVGGTSSSPAGAPTPAPSSAGPVEPSAAAATTAVVPGVSKESPIQGEASDAAGGRATETPSKEL